jgi:transposase
MISEQTGVARNTLRKYLREFDESGLSYEAVKDLSDSELTTLFVVDVLKDPDKVLTTLYDLFPTMLTGLRKEGATRKQAWDQYKLVNPDGLGLSAFCHRFAAWKKRVHPSMRVIHKNGDKMFVDYTGHRLCLTNKLTGVETPVEVFVAILGGSQMTYVEAVMSQKKEDFIGACERAFIFYGGVTKAIVPDNLKSAVTKGSKFEPILNETFADFADHYGTTILPARPHEPKDKSLVEGAVKIAYMRIFTKLRAKLYESLEELNADILVALAEHNKRLFQGRKYSRHERFDAAERETLMPLPVHTYQLRKQLYATVSKTGYVCIAADEHYYSVPYALVGKKVKVRYSVTVVSIYYDGDCVATHERELNAHSYTTNDDHKPASHKYMADRTPEKLLQRAKEVSEDVRLYVAQILARASHPEQAQTLGAGILHAAKKFGAERTSKACKRAMHFDMYSYRTILMILANGLENASLSDDSDLIDMPEHENIRGRSYYN